MYVALFVFLIFYNALEFTVPLGNYWDELATFLVLCWGGYSLWKDRHIRKQEIQNWLLLFLLLVIGALGNVFSPGIQDHRIAILKDVVAFSKFPVVFFLLQRRAGSVKLQEVRIASVAKVSRWIVLVTLCAVVVGYFVDLGFYTGEIRIVPAFDFVFSHPTFFVSAYVMIAATLIAESVKKNRVFLLLDCFLIFMAQRSKGYIFIVFVLLFIVLGEDRISRILTFVFGTGKEKVKLGRLALAVVALVLMILVLGKSKLEATFNIPYPVPRIVLHAVGIRILLDYFPLGSGLGTFASYLSGRYYSNIYEMYQISDVIGITREDYCYISDVFWPYIYGQFGVLGLPMYVCMLFRIFIQQFRTDISDASRLAISAVWIYALIASTSEAYFTNGTGVQMALFLTVIIGYGDWKSNIEKELPTDGGPGA